MTWPALIFSTDLLPDQGRLNGRRWSSQLLLRLWLKATQNEGLDLLAADPQVLDFLRSSVDEPYRNHRFRFCSITDPKSLSANGALFIPDPSLGAWASWRQAAGHQAFSLVGQIHTLSTTAVMTMLDALVVEPVQEWDALICSSTAGRDVVERLMEDRREQLRRRCGATHFPSPQLPVIPLPLNEDSFRVASGNSLEARRQLQIPPEDAVVLWLGRRSLLTKADPWPAYRVLQRVARRFSRPLWLIECGPDDTPDQAKHFKDLQRNCPDLKFLRLGGDGHVPEEVKHQALLASNLVLSLVDNIQETFGLSIAEAMAAGRPVVASNWNGYRDLVRHGVDGYLIPSRWDEQAQSASFPLGWMQRLELSSFPHISGSFAQLVQLDLEAAEAAVLTLLSQPALASAMGRAARNRALEQFAPDRVMNMFSEVFDELAARREASCCAVETSFPPMRFDPVRCFAGYASNVAPFDSSIDTVECLPDALVQARQPFADQLSQALPSGCRLDWQELLRRKHTGCSSEHVMKE